MKYKQTGTNRQTDIKYKQTGTNRQIDRQKQMKGGIGLSFADKGRFF